MWHDMQALYASGGQESSFWDFSDWYWMMGTHGLFWLVFLGFIALMVVYAARGAARSEAAARTPRSVLEERYARGDIDRGDYLERRADLA